jgi:propanediol dehydratase small subunit
LRRSCCILLFLQSLLDAAAEATDLRLVTPHLQQQIELAVDVGRFPLPIAD